MALLITAGFDDACYLSCKVSLWFLAIGHWFVYKSRMLSTFFFNSGAQTQINSIAAFLRTGIWVEAGEHIRCYEITFFVAFGFFCAACFLEVWIS